MLDRIRILAQVVESGSFSRAARALNQAPSSVTRAIDALEQQLGIPLFKRSTRQLVLTEQGAYFLARSLPLLEEADQLVQSLQPLSVAPEGPLRVSVFESFGASWLSPRLPDFLARYPGVRLEVALDNRMVDLDAENVDVAVRIGKPADSSLHTRHLLTNRSLLVASPAYLARHGEPAHPAELAHHNCLIRGHGRQRQHWYFQQGTEREKVAVQGNLASVGGTPLLCAALAGCGVRRAAVELDGAARHRRGHPAAAAARVARLPLRGSPGRDPRGVSWRPLPQTPDPRLHRLSGRGDQAPARAALTATEPPGETLKTQTPGSGPGVWK